MDSYCMTDTIYALASGLGTAGVAVIRVSGSLAKTAVERLAHLKNPEPRRSYFVALTNASGVALDHALVLYFSAPHSFTGEDVAEFQVHGGRSVIQSVMMALSEIPGCRPAERGEFSRRAVVYGKMDLTAAEGMLDLIHAQTEHQRRQALSQMDGNLGALYDGWREKLRHHMAYLEAFIDFPEEDIPPEKLGQIDADVTTLIDEIKTHLNDDHRGQRLRDGFQIAIIGAPNVGKSSLINALAKREVAIVSHIAGTTRDVVTAHLDVAGFPVILADTAGLRETDQEIEAEGIARAVTRADQADLILHIQDAASWPKTESLPKLLDKKNVITIWNKADLFDEFPSDVCAVSAKTGAGIDALWNKVKDILESQFTSNNNGFITRDRYRVALHECVDALTKSIQSCALELKAEDMRLAARALGRITGRIDVEELLDVIFRDFCIGK